MARRPSPEPRRPTAAEVMKAITVLIRYGDHGTVEERNRNTRANPENDKSRRLTP